MRQVQHAWQDSLWGRFLSMAVVIVLVIGITSISTTMPVAHADGGSSPCSFATPCTFGISSAQQPCVTQNGSFCVSLIQATSNGLTFRWCRCLWSWLSSESLDHYMIQQALLDANNSSNSIPATMTESAHDSQGNLITDWTWGPLQANQLYVFQIEGCDSSNTCTPPSSPVAIDTGYFFSTTTGYFASTIQTRQSLNCNNQISQVSGAWPNVTYHLNNCLIQNLNTGYSSLQTIAGTVGALVKCPGCIIALGIVSALIQYELQQLANTSANCKGAGADIQIQLLFVQVKADC